MFLILEIDDFTGRWTRATNTLAYDSFDEALKVGEELELFDAIIVEFKKFI